MNSLRRDDDKPVYKFVSPYAELNAGLWTLFAGATVFLGLRIWVKLTTRHGLWYDDHILILSWAVLISNNIILIHQYRTGYMLEDSEKSWDDRMHILINVTSCLTNIGQAWTKTAFGVTLLRISERWQRWILWFCIITMNAYMVARDVFQWAKVCNEKSYQNWYRLDFCIGKTFREDFKEGGNIYNVIMDFIFASFPWLITRGLEMRKVEKIGLCVTMSLGMIVAIVAAVRISWKDNGNGRDEYYIWRNAMSQIWYSSEVTGTIMVQCIPVLRPILRDIYQLSTSRKLNSTANGPSTGWTDRKRASTVLDPIEEGTAKLGDRVELRNIPEESESSSTERLPSASPTEESKTTVARSDSWVMTRFGGRTGQSIDVEHDGASHSSFGLDVEQGDQGLSPPPRRVVP